MTTWQIALASLKFHLRTNVAIALGVAAATAVLAGALIMGDSMRHSLQSLTMDRLGKIDEILISDGFFRQELGGDIIQSDTFQNSYSSVTPVILFPGGTVQYQPGKVARRAGQVTVLGIKDEFWSFDDSGLNHPANLQPWSVVINQALADDLQVDASDVNSGQARITVRIPKQHQLPADSALGRKTDLIESIVDLEIAQIIPNQGLGRFGMYPSQAEPMIVFLPIETLQDSLRRTVLSHKSDPAQANALLIASKSTTPPTADVTSALRQSIRPTLEDYGLTLKRVTKKIGGPSDAKTIFDYWSLSSDQLVLTDEAVKSISRAFPNATPVFTYLANDIRRPELESGIPFSMIAAINFGDSFRPTSTTTNMPIRNLEENEIVINQWAADDLGIQAGDKVIVTFFEPETTHATQVEQSATMNVVDIARLTRSVHSPLPNPGSIAPEPTIAYDPDLTPEVPGVTDAKSIENWDLPFQTADKIRPQDDDYWDDFKTTPKAFVSLATGQDLWKSRFGMTTSFRIPIDSGNAADIGKRLLDQLVADNSELGIHLVPIKRQGLKSSSGSTPFDVLFLALSMFVIAAALILVSLLFRLSLQQRAPEVGLLKASGFKQNQIRRLWLSEMSIVSLAGALLGVILGIGYAYFMIWALSKWLLGVSSESFLTLNLSPLSLGLGVVSGLVICVLTIAWSLRRTRDQPICSLLEGRLETPLRVKPGGWRFGHILVGSLVVIALLLTGTATQLSGEAQAGAFMGAGFLILTALLIFVFQLLQGPANLESAGRLSLSRLAMLSTRRNPLRSTLTIGLVAVASFLIAAVSSFRLTPSETGTAGFDWVAQSSQPIFDDLNTSTGQMQALGAENQMTPGTEVMSIRYKPGEDASCNNLYQSTQPRALGVTDGFVERFDDSEVGQFAWAGSLARSDSEKKNPWRLLDSTRTHAGTLEDPIPVVIDKNTANYSLKIYMLDTVKRVDYDTGETIYYRVVGFLTNSVLQGSLLMSERNFENAFPTLGGYRYFLIRDGQGQSNNESNIALLEDRLSDQGFDSRSASKMLAGYMMVQNTYLSFFQALGALGLLLGTFGLAAVQVRSVLERRQELGLMRAVGFKRSKLSLMVLLENAWLLWLGLSVGIAAALFTTVPHWFVGTATVPWIPLALMFSGIVGVGLIAGWLASRVISKLPLLGSLRG